MTMLPEADLTVDCAQGIVHGWTETALADMLKLAAFGAWCAREFRDTLTDVDGGSAQDAMERLGVIVKHEAEAPCGDGCVCVEYGDFPHDCYKFPDGVRQAIADAGLVAAMAGNAYANFMGRP